MKNKEIFIIGSKGIPAKYGGFETFVEKLTEKRKNENIKYHVACMGEKDKEFTHNNARCFCVKVPNIGPAKAVYYDIMALKESIKYIKKNKIDNAIVYILACRIGPFINHYKKQLKKLNCSLYINPDGHEWMRAKWSKPIRKYWKISEQMMVKYCDLAICDSVNIEKYIHEQYDGKGINGKNPNTTFIAYNRKESFLEDIEDIKNQMIYAIENRYVNGIEIVKEISDENSNKAVFPVVFTSMLRSGSDTDNEIYYPENMKEVYALSQTPQVSLDHQVYNRNGKYVFVWDYVSQLYDEKEIMNCFDRYIQFIREIADNNQWN